MKAPAILLPLILLAFPLNAETFHWSDGAFLDHSFTNADNWFEGEVPLIGDVCVFEVGSVVNRPFTEPPRYGLLRFIGPFEAGGGPLNAGALEVFVRNGAGDVTLTGGYRTTGLPARIEVFDGGTLRINGLVANAETRLIAHQDNIFPQASEIVIQNGLSGSGELFLSKPPGVTAVPHRLVISSGSTGPRSARLALLPIVAACGSSDCR